MGRRRSRQVFHDDHSMAELSDFVKIDFVDASSWSCSKQYVKICSNPAKLVTDCKQGLPQPQT